MIHKTKTYLKVVTASLFLVSCATRYQAIKPATQSYPFLTNENGISVEYKTGVLTGNYAKREVKSGVSLIAARITNNSQQDIIPRTRLHVYSGEKELKFLPLSTFIDATQQNPEKYLKFLFLIPLNGYASEETTYNGEITSQKKRIFPVGLLLGPALAFGNQARAKKSNARFKEDLNGNDLLDKVIRPGETAYGLIAVDGRSSLNGITIKTQ